MLKRPPDILITTPESLYLMLTSQARETLRSVRWVIVDEIHAMAATKRGAHLALSLERLERLTDTPPQRIGLSATQRPLEEIARFLGRAEDDADGPRPVTIVDAGHRKPMEIEVIVPVEDMAELGGVVERAGPAPNLLGPSTDGRSPSAASIWPAIHPKLLELIRAHRSTIVFVNARRMAERLAARLNELAERGPGARAPRLARARAADRGRGRAEGGTPARDRGDVLPRARHRHGRRRPGDPGGVARARSRAACSGSAGPATRSASPAAGKIFPKFRGDLLEAAVVDAADARRPDRGDALPAQPARRARPADRRDVRGRRVARRRAARGRPPRARTSPSSPTTCSPRCSTCCPAATRATTSPSCGRALVWDRTTGIVRAREGAGAARHHERAARSPTAASSACSSPTGRASASSTRRWCTRAGAGEVFVLGASSWRIEDITRDRVVVVPAPGEPGKMPFWKGDKPGPAARARPRARRVHARARRRRAAPIRSTRLRDDVGLDELAAENLVKYVDDQREATGAVPDDRTIVVERFRDELGDWRLCILSPFGQRVHAPWALAIEARLAERVGPGAQVLWSDDGIVIRLPGGRGPDPARRPAVRSGRDRGGGRRASCRARRCSRARSARRRRARCCSPAGGPGQRTPLWQQRQRSADLLVAAAKHPTFPMLLETTRECLRDVFDVPALREVMADLRSRKTKLVAVDTERASPFAQSLLFRWVAIYMYEGDAPLAERRAAALALDRDLLRELLGEEELRDLLDPAALDELELELQGLAEGRRARNPDDVHDLLVSVGDLTETEIAARTEQDPRAVDRTGPRRGPRRCASAWRARQRLAAVEDAAALRDALGVSLPLGLPAVFTEPTERPLETPGRPLRADPRSVPGQRRRPRGWAPAWTGCARRWTRWRRPVASPTASSAPGRRRCRARVVRRGRAAAPASPFARGAPQGGRAGRRGHARAVPAGVAGRRHAVERPRRADGRDRSSAGRRRSRVDPGARRPAARGCAASARPTWTRCARAATWSGSAPARSAPTTAGCRCTSGTRCGCSRRRRRRTRRRASCTSRSATHLRDRGASFWPDLVQAAGTADERVVLAALWDLVWAGEVTNDTLAPLRALTMKRSRATPRAGSRPRPGALRRTGPPAGAGRWSLVAPLLEPAPSPTEVAHARALQLLDRHGVLTREAVLAEGVPGGFAGVYGVLKALEMSGKVRRGYFVDGLGAAQFAVPGAVDRIRALREPTRGEERTAVLLAATDPAQPYGAALSWPEGPGRPARQAGAFVVLVDGALAAFLERGARSLLTFGVDAGAWADALASLTKDGRLRKIELTRIDGAPAGDAPIADRLRAAGFTDGYRGLTLRS